MEAVLALCGLGLLAAAGLSAFLGVFSGNLYFLIIGLAGAFFLLGLAGIAFWLAFKDDGIICPACASKIPSEAKICPYCRMATRTVRVRAQGR